mmetsp:Transcript_34387/g.97537  ORF Transcript_34387/g.97537 Transcript_34387/m.97537 type:complete len:213 (+) Transcript_34387:981-1619(+)
MGDLGGNWSLAGILPHLLFVPRLHEGVMLPDVHLRGVLIPLLFLHAGLAPPRRVLPGCQGEGEVVFCDAPGSIFQGLRSRLALLGPHLGRPQHPGHTPLLPRDLRDALAWHVPDVPPGLQEARCQSEGISVLGRLRVGVRVVRELIADLGLTFPPSRQGRFGCTWFGAIRAEGMVGSALRGSRTCCAPGMAQNGAVLGAELQKCGPPSVLDS